MKLLRNYFLKEFLSPFILTFLVLSFVMMLLGNLKQIAELIINRGVSPMSVIKLVLLLAPYLITYTLPISFLIAMMLALGRLSGDNEIIAIKASGVNLIHLIMPLILVGLIISLSLVIFNDRAASYAHFAYLKTLIDVGLKNPTAAFEEGVFINSFEKYILFVYRIDQKKNKLYNVRIYQPQGEDKPTRTIIAKSGEFITVPEKNTVKLKLMDGTSDEPDPNDPTNFYKLNFRTYFMNLNLSKKYDKDISKKPKEMNIAELHEAIAQKKEEGIDPAPLVVKIHEKITLAFSAIAFILMGAPLSIITRRREKSINIGLAVLIIMIYYPLTIGCEALGMEGLLNPAFALWIPNMLYFAIGGLLTYRLCAS